MWLKSSEEDGGVEVWPVRDRSRRRRRRGKGERDRERERKKRAHGHRKSGAFHSHAKSSDGSVCSHPGDVATKCTPLPSNHCYRQ